MDKTSNDPVRGNGHARAVQRLPARRVRDFSWPCSRVNLRGGAQKAAVARNRATFAWPCAVTPCTRQVGPTSLGQGTVAGEGNDVHGPPALSPTVHRACESGAGGVVVRAPRTRAWCGKMALLAIPGGCLRCLRFHPNPAPAALSGSFPHFCPFAGPSCSDKNTQQQLCVPAKWYACHSGQYMLWGHRRYHHNTTQRLLYTTHVMNLHFTLMRLARIWAMEAGVGPIPQR